MDAATLTALALFALALAAGLAIGALLGWKLRDGRAGGEIAALRERLAASEAGAHALREQVASQRDEAAGREARARDEQAVLRALAPVGDALAHMQRQVAQLERDRTEQYGSLSAQLRASLESEEALRRTTESLAGALRSNATRGVWGETALRRVVEAAGLTRHVDFSTQEHLAGEYGAARPDLVVRLPGGKAIPVDAKVPLDAYLAASALGESDEDRARRDALLAQHAKAVRAHVDALSKKEYWNALPTSPEFVICFLPNEALLATALDADPGLLEYAFSRRVALASPVNLWAVLKTIAYTWTQQEVSEQARDLFELGRTLYERLAGLAGHAEALRRSIEKTVESYNKFVGTLESRVLVTARRFPGIDETKLGAVDAPDPVTAQTRTFTSPEMLAEIGDLRERL